MSYHGRGEGGPEAFAPRKMLESLPFHLKETPFCVESALQKGTFVHLLKFILLND